VSLRFVIANLCETTVFWNGGGGGAQAWFEGSIWISCRDTAHLLEAVYFKVVAAVAFAVGVVVVVVVVTTMTVTISIAITTTP
jgi:hypothetical protein